ncbi:hypothetical protein V5799_021875 [Amblyomma americanum]|uniref:Uncharacterized protein n=1 Tax=Amblyomma americanum TaxID=6943 RepID=A0AAQ4FP44_AMBAM
MFRDNENFLRVIMPFITFGSNTDTCMPQTYSLPTKDGICYFPYDASLETLSDSVDAYMTHCMKPFDDRGADRTNIKLAMHILLAYNVMIYMRGDMGCEPKILEGRCANANQSQYYDIIRNNYDFALRYILRMFDIGVLPTYAVHGRDCAEISAHGTTSCLNNARFRREGLLSTDYETFKSSDHSSFRHKTWFPKYSSLLTDVIFPPALTLNYDRSRTEPHTISILSNYTLLEYNPDSPINPMSRMYTIQVLENVVRTIFVVGHKDDLRDVNPAKYYNYFAYVKDTSAINALPPGVVDCRSRCRNEYTDEFVTRIECENRVRTAQQTRRKTGVCDVTHFIPRSWCNESIAAARTERSLDYFVTNKDCNDTIDSVSEYRLKHECKDKCSTDFKDEFVPVDQLNRTCKHKCGTDFRSEFMLISQLDTQLNKTCKHKCGTDFRSEFVPISQLDIQLNKTCEHKCGTDFKDEFVPVGQLNKTCKSKCTTDFKDEFTTVDQCKADVESEKNNCKDRCASEFASEFVTVAECNRMVQSVDCKSKCETDLDFVSLSSHLKDVEVEKNRCKSTQTMQTLC